MELCDEVSCLDAGVCVEDLGCLLARCGFEDGGGDDVAVIGDGTGEENAARFGFAAQPCEIFRHQVFVALGDVPAMAFFQQAEEVGFEIARHVGAAGAG